MLRWRKKKSLLLLFCLNDQTSTLTLPTKKEREVFLHASQAKSWIFFVPNLEKERERQERKRGKKLSFFARGSERDRVTFQGQQYSRTWTCTTYYPTNIASVSLEMGLLQGSYITNVALGTPGQVLEWCKKKTLRATQISTPTANYVPMRFYWVFFHDCGNTAKKPS